MKYCKKCVMPDTRPGIKLNKGGVCQAGVNYENRKKIDWKDRRNQLAKLCKQHKRSSGYDCMIAVSGGKDSHYQVHIMKEVMGMNPILVSVEDNYPMTKAGAHNIKNISEEFGCDIISLKPNIKDQKIATRYTFENHGMPTWYIDRLIYSYPLKLAIDMGIPLLVYGENVSFEYGGEGAEETPSAMGQINNGVAPDIDISHLNLGTTLMTPPHPWELRVLEPIYLSYYVPWNSCDNYLFAQTRGFKDLVGEWDRSHHVEFFDQIDSRAYLLHPWMKYPKYGHAYATDYASRFIRYGIWSREHAIKAVKKHDHALDRKTVRDFCDFAGYTKKEFWAIVNKFYNTDLFEKDWKGKWVLKQEVW